MTTLQFSDDVVGEWWHDFDTSSLQTLRDVVAVYDRLDRTFAAAQAEYAAEVKWQDVQVHYSEEDVHLLEDRLLLRALSLLAAQLGITEQAQVEVLHTLHHRLPKFYA